MILWWYFGETCGTLILWWNFGTLVVLWWYLHQGVFVGKCFKSKLFQDLGDPGIVRLLAPRLYDGDLKGASIGSWVGHIGHCDFNSTERAILPVSHADVNSTASHVVHRSRAVDIAYSAVDWGLGRAWCWYSQGSG